MTTAAPSAVLATIQPAFTDAERVALAGFLAGYRGLTREAYALDLRQFASWCRARSLALFAVPPRRHRGLRPETGSDGPGPGHRHPAAVHHCRVLQVRRRGRAPGSLAGRARPPSTGRLRVPCGRAGPQRARRAARRRRPRPATRACADLAAHAEWAADPEATGADIEHLGLERGHRTLTVTRKGGKVVTVPLAPRTTRAIDLAIGERTEGPVFLARDGRRLDRHGAGRIVRTTARRAGITKAVTPHALRHAFITAALDAGVPLRDVEEAASHADPRTTMRRQSGPAAAWTGTPPTSSPPTSRAPPGNPRGPETRPPGDAPAARRQSSRP
jgi:integrase/recombinase XerD